MFKVTLEVIGECKKQYLMFRRTMNFVLSF